VRFSLIILGMLAWLLQVCTGCDEYDPCSGVEYGSECQELADCSYVTDCWCGYCIPNMCTGEIEFNVVLESCVRREIEKDGGSLRYENVKGIWRIEGCGHYDWWITSLWGIQCLTGLRRLDVSENFIRDIEPLSGLIKLSYLRLSQCLLENLDPIAGLVNLTELDLSINTHITDISPLAGLKMLQILNLSDNEIGNIEPLAELTNLKELNISQNGKYEDVGGERVYIGISDISPLSGMTSLEKLDFSRCGRISDLTPLSGMANLSELDAERASIENIGTLAGLTSLSVLNLSSNEIRDIGPLVDNPGIGEGDRVSIGDNPIDCTEQASNIQALLDRGVELTVYCP